MGSKPFLGVTLDLPDPLPGETEILADLVERPAWAADPVPLAKHFGLAGMQPAERLLDRVG